MDWLWNLLDQLQKSAALATIKDFSLLDWVFVIAVLFGMMQGSRKGFSDMFGRFLVILLVSLLTLTFYKGAARFLSIRIPALPGPWAEFIVFLFLGVSFLVTLSWCGNFIGKFFRLEAQGVFKSFGGMILGVLWILLLFSFVAQAFLIFPVSFAQQIFKPGHSFSGHAVSKLAPDLQALVMGPFQKSAAVRSPVSPKTGG